MQTDSSFPDLNATFWYYSDIVDGTNLMFPDGMGLVQGTPFNGFEDDYPPFFQVITASAAQTEFILSQSIKPDPNVNPLQVFIDGAQVQYASASGDIVDLYRPCYQGQQVAFYMQGVPYPLLNKSLPGTPTLPQATLSEAANYTLSTMNGVPEQVSALNVSFSRIPTLDPYSYYDESQIQDAIGWLNNYYWISSSGSNQGTLYVPFNFNNVPFTVTYNYNGPAAGSGTVINGSTVTNGTPVVLTKTETVVPTTDVPLYYWLLPTWDQSRRDVVIDLLRVIYYLQSIATDIPFNGYPTSTKTQSNRFADCIGDPTASSTGISVMKMATTSFQTAQDEGKDVPVWDGAARLNNLSNYATTYLNAVYLLEDIQLSDGSYLLEGYWNNNYNYTSTTDGTICYVLNYFNKPYVQTNSILTPDIGNGFLSDKQIINDNPSGPTPHYVFNGGGYLARDEGARLLNQLRKYIEELFS